MRNSYIAAGIAVVTLVLVSSVFNSFDPSAQHN